MPPPPGRTISGTLPTAKLITVVAQAMLSMTTSGKFSTRLAASHHA
jgi:hypothetical protein